MIRFVSKQKPNKLKGVALLRLDFNTEDEWRMQVSLPTVRLLLRHAEKVIVLSHRGRPQGVEPKLSLRRDARALERFLDHEVIFLPHFNWVEIQKKIKSAPRGSLFLLENLRFLPGEAKNDFGLAKKLAGLGDYYVNDAFPVSHRQAASVVGITKFLPSFGGPELEREVKSLTRVMQNPKQPLVCILGGGKAHDKLGIMKYFRRIADSFLMGGVAANSLVHVRGADVGKSRIDTDPHDLAEIKIISHYSNLYLPTDWRKRARVILDVGSKTAKMYAQRIAKARTILWNGPMGLIEEARFAQGTLAVARAILANRKAYTVAGGGETIMFLKKHKLDQKFSFISTGGTAMFDFLAGEKLPGIAALERSRGK